MGEATASAAASAVRYTGPIDVARHVIRMEGGSLALFKGLTPTLMREVPGNAAMFGAYEATKQVERVSVRGLNAPHVGMPALAFVGVIC